MVNYNEVTRKELIKILKQYEDDSIRNNYDYIIDNAVVNEEWKDVTFNLNFSKIILNTDDLSYKGGGPNTDVISNVMPEGEAIETNNDYQKEEIAELIKLHKENEIV